MSAEGMTVTLLATGLAAAVAADEARKKAHPTDCGFDLSAGLFDLNVSNWIRQVAIDFAQATTPPATAPDAAKLFEQIEYAVLAMITTGNSALLRAAKDAFAKAFSLLPEHRAGNPPGNIKPDTNKQVFFYEQDLYVLSNFSAFRVWVAGRDCMARHFNTSEEAYHWQKFDHLMGRGVQQLLEDVKSAHEAFKIAQEHKELRRPNWDEEKMPVMKRILHAKAEQHEYVRRKLLATGERELVEDSWRDPYWGWGPNRDGQNMLGKLWMEVRADLRHVGKRNK